MVYQINDRIFHPRAGQALFGNSNTMHTGRMENGRDCRYISITFHPRLLYGYQGSRIASRYTDPLTEHTALPAVCFDLSEEWHREVIRLLEDIIRIDGQRYETYEMDIQMDLFRFWKLLYLHCRPDREPAHTAGRKNQERIRQMLSFIHENYQSDITLDDISRHIHICKSECCRVFKGYMKESLFEYLLKYRIEKSIPDVLEGKLGAFGKRMGHLLFKQAVDQDLMANLLASDINVGLDTLQKLRVRCVKNVKETNGEIDFQDAFLFQKRIEE